MTPPQGSANDPLIGTVIAERYRVTAQIGEGGMGRVYLAEHVRMGRRSALKVMSPALAATPDAITRFNREASNASRINHPNVAAVYDFGETDAGLLYIAMEFVEGETLSAIIQREGRLPVARAAAITKGVADALAAAHHLEIIHRDLKPDNIMIARQLDGSDWVKVVDFGIAKTVTQGGAGQTVTTIGVSLGTPEYMSPEQLAGEKLDARTDIYSLGLVLFHMLTGELPYPRLTSKETLVRRLVSAPATLGEVCPDVAWPPALQAALNRALAPDVADRYATVAEFGRDVVRAAQEADADPDRTLRVTSPARPAAVAPAAVPATRRAERVRTGPVGPGHTNAQPAEPRRSRAGLAALVVGLVAVTAAGGWYAMRGRAATTPAATSAMPADSTQAHAPDSTHTDTPDSTPAHTAESTKPQAPRSAPAAAPAGAGQVATLRDSVQRLQRAFARQADSLSRAEAASPAATQALGGSVVARSFRSPHPWLQANGDSASSAAQEQGGLQGAVNDIRGHLQRAGAMIAAGQYARVGPEFRDAQAEIKVLRDVFPGSRVPAALELQLRTLRSDALTACLQAAQVDSTRARRCAAFQQRTAAAPFRGRLQQP